MSEFLNKNGKLHCMLKQRKSKKITDSFMLSVIFYGSKLDIWYPYTKSKLSSAAIKV